MSTDAVVALATVAGVVVTLLLGVLGWRATRRSTVDARAAADLAARDRLIDQLQEERNHAELLLQHRDRELSIHQTDRTAIEQRLRDALDQVDMLTGHNRILEEQLRQARQRP